MDIIGPVERCGDTYWDYVIFPNGYSVDIDFGESRFDSEYRICVLKDPEGNIISEIKEKNPHRIPDDVLESFFGW